MKNPLKLICCDVQQDFCSSQEGKLYVPPAPVSLEDPHRPIRFSDLLEVIDLRDVQVVKPLPLDADPMIKMDVKILTPDESAKLWPPHCVIATTPTQDPDDSK